MKQICFAFLLFAGAICYSNAAVEDSTELPSRYTAQMVTAYELQTVHWRFLSPEHSDYIGRMKDGFLPESSISSTLRFFGVPGVTNIRSDLKLRESDRTSLKSIQNGADNTWSAIDGRRWRYFAPIRATKRECLLCHKFDGENLDRPSQEDTNPVIAYVSVELEKQ